MKPKHRRPAVTNEEGFNLVEVLASVAIVAIAAAGLTASTVTTIRSNAFSRDAMVATSLAQDRIEQFRAMNFPAQLNQLVSGSDVVAGPAGPTQFRREWVVAQGPTPGLAQVTVTVRWRGPEERSIQTIAYICRSTSC